MYLEFNGGTYISQVTAGKLGEALKKWANQLKSEELASWDLDRQAVIDIAKEIPTPLDGLINVWCSTGLSSKGKQLVLNTVSTERELA
jgi:hypothetical protein